MGFALANLEPRFGVGPNYQAYKTRASPSMLARQNLGPPGMLEIPYLAYETSAASS